MDTKWKMELKKNSLCVRFVRNCEKQQRHAGCLKEILGVKKKKEKKKYLVYVYVHAANAAGLVYAQEKALAQHVGKELLAG